LIKSDLERLPECPGIKFSLNTLCIVGHHDTSYHIPRHSRIYKEVSRIQPNKHSDQICKRPIIIERQVLHSEIICTEQLLIEYRATVMVLQFMELSYSRTFDPGNESSIGVTVVLGNIRSLTLIITEPLILT